MNHEKVRDGPVAVTLATRACELSNWTDGEFVLTLAAAHAEVGDFEKAKEQFQRSMKIGVRSSVAVQNDMKKQFDRVAPYRMSPSIKEPMATIEVGVPPSPSP
jgi:hypothetical protein